ncbi:MAG: hypothetical protein OER77_08695 [Myxococcales bacterium]|nr:hypothetical protein [Myxococcales bacterium]
MADEVAKTHNHDVDGIVRRMNRYMDEIQHAASAGVSQTSGADIKRIRSYIADLRAEHEGYITQRPQLDLPETHPREIVLELPIFDRKELENEGLHDIVNLLIIGRDELIMSQSSQIASTFIPADSDRLKAVIDKIAAKLDIIESSGALDLPESSPQEELPGPGLRDRP